MYKLPPEINGRTSNGIIRIADDAFIPDDMANRDWQEYQEWLAADPENQPLPADGE